MRTLPVSSGRVRTAAAGWRWGLGLTLLGGLGIARANDNLVDAIVLSGSLPINTAVVSTVTATAEVDEPDHDFDSITAHSIWYEWTAPADMAVEMNTFGSTPTEPTPGAQFDTVLAVYTGSTFATLDKVIGNDDTDDPGTGNNKQSRLRFWALSGTTYKIAIDGYSDDTGNALLNVLAPTATRPAHDNWADADVITGALPQANTTLTNMDATVQGDEPEHVTESAFSSSVWYAWTSPTSGSAAAHTTGSDFDTVLAVYRGSALDDLTLVSFNDDNGDEVTGDGSQSTVEFFAFIGVTYYFAVDGFAGQEGDVHFSLQWGPDPPPNDDVNDATGIISTNTISVHGPTGGSTIEPPLEIEHHPGLAAISTIWYRWTAPLDVSTSVEMNTLGSNFDTVMAVYTGTTFSVFVDIASNDDAGGILSRVRFSPVPGETYRIVIHGKEGAQGAAFLNILPGPSPPANDDFANSEMIVGSAATGSNVGATVEAFEPTHVLGIVNYGTVWYSWTADLDSRYRATTAASDFDTILAVYSGTTIESLVQLDSNDNAGGIGSQVIFDAAAGQTYHFAVGGKLLAEGNIDISLDTVGSYAEWLALWPSLTGDDRFQGADKDGDGYPNAIEMLCGLDPTLNSRPEIGVDPNSGFAPVTTFIDPDILETEFEVNSAFIGVPRNGGDPVWFGGEVLGAGLAPIDTAIPQQIGINRYKISTMITPDLMRLLRIVVLDPNGDSS